ncbi:hypothetical protein D3C76_677310 [compost metagenome]
MQEIVEQALFLPLQVLGVPQHDLVALGEQGLLQTRYHVAAAALGQTGHDHHYGLGGGGSQRSRRPVGDIAKFVHRSLDALTHLVRHQLGGAQGARHRHGPHAGQLGHIVEGHPTRATALLRF